MLPILCAAQRIAVLEFKPGVGVSINDVDGLSSIFVTYFHPQNYTIVERSQIDRIIDEQNFQRSSLTEQQMVRIGEILNLSKVVVGDINIIMGEYNVDVRVINVESGTIAATEGTAFNQGSYREGMKNLAINLANKLSPTQEQSATIVQIQDNHNRIYTKADLLKKGFKFNDSLTTFATVDGANGPATIQAFVGSETTTDNWAAYTEKKLDKSWYISGEKINGKLNGLLILFANGSEKFRPEIFITYVCEGEIAYPILSLDKGYADFLPRTHKLYGKFIRGMSIKEIHVSYNIYSTLFEEFNDTPMATELMKIYGSQIYTNEFLVNGSDGNFDIKILKDNFDSFMNSDSYISPAAWQKR